MKTLRTIDCHERRDESRRYGPDRNAKPFVGIAHHTE